MMGRHSHLRITALPFLFVLVQETLLYGATVRINEPVGVIGIACPDVSPLLAFVSLIAPAVVRGNAVVVIPSEKYPTVALDFYQVSVSSQGSGTLYPQGLYQM